MSPAKKIGDPVEFKLAKGVYLLVEKKIINSKQIVKLIPQSEVCDIKEEFWVSQCLLKHL